MIFNCSPGRDGPQRNTPKTPEFPLKISVLDKGCQPSYAKSGDRDTPNLIYKNVKNYDQNKKSPFIDTHFV